MATKKTKPAAVLAALDAPAPAAAPKKFLSSGSTLFNLAMSANPFRGYREGAYYNIIGDSNAGKTFLALTCFAEATISKAFADYDLYHDNNEDGALMDFAAFFGQKVQDKVRYPKYDKDGEGLCSETVEQFYDNVSRICALGRPFIYVMDSENGLTSEAEIELNAKNIKAREKGTETGDSYTDGKAKYHSTHLRDAIRQVKKCRGILIIVSQTRANFKGYAEKTRAGGNALKFYATAEIWLSVVKSITVRVKERDRDIGTLAEAYIKKNRVSGRKGKASIQIYTTHGIDDVLANIDYLVFEKHWTKTQAGIKATEFGVTLPRRKLATFIDNKGKAKDLAKIVATVWTSIIEATSLGRKSKYC